MKIEIRKYGNGFAVDPISEPGSPRMGVGRTMDQALADFLRAYQNKLGLHIEVAESAQPAELARRKRELAKR